MENVHYLRSKSFADKDIILLRVFIKIKKIKVNKIINLVIDRKNKIKSIKNFEPDNGFN